MGSVKDNYRQFTKVGYEGRLSVVSEAQVRTGSIRASAHVKPLKLGDWVEMSIDLDKHVAYFTIWPGNSQTQLSRSSYAEFAFGSKISDSYKDAGNSSHQPDLSTGHL